MVGAVVLLLAGAAGLAAVGGTLVVMAHGWFQERGLGKERRRLLPPGNMGWPLIGNMWSFLRAFKAGRPDSFIGRFVKRLKRINPQCPIRYLPHPRPLDNCLAKIIKVSPTPA